jgi:hypothetical protein
LGAGYSALVLDCFFSANTPDDISVFGAWIDGGGNTFV